MRVTGLNTVFHRALQYQSIFTNPINSINQLRSLSAFAPKMDPNINKIISFWFEGSAVEKWFMPNATLDAEIKSNFGDLVAQARTSALDSWTEKPEGVLAILILLDQFTRNIYRGSPESCSSDPKALDIATRAILKGFDRELPVIQQPFLYLPLMHSEELVSHVAAKALYEEYEKRCKSEFEAKFAQGSLEQRENHTKTLLQFGRYPSRNKVLGRESTEEEEKFLEEKPHGF